MRTIHNFCFSESEIFVRGELTSQIRLNQLSKLDFARTRSGAVCGRVRDVNATESIKLICPTRLGKNSDYEAGVARSITTWSDGAILAWNVRETSRIARRAETNPLLRATHAFSAM